MKIVKNNVSITKVIARAVEACKSFATCSENFFDFEKTSSWRGWENWLTVDIVRRLDSKYVIPFYSYSYLGNVTKKKMDIYVSGSSKIAVEIKVNYVERQFIDKLYKKKKALPDRITDDLKKLEELVDEKTYLLMLVATVFKSKQPSISYKRIVDKDLEQRFNNMNWRWYNCPAEGGHILLLAISDSGRLPSEGTVSKIVELNGRPR